MLELLVIEESCNEWQSPVALVSKLDSTIQCCIDLRVVYAISEFHAYPMPRVDELLGWLDGARYITALDLRKEYWQIPPTPESQEKTTFAALFGLCQFRIVPLDLHGAPATFHQLMDQAVQSHGSYAAAYLDDMVIYS